MKAGLEKRMIHSGEADDPWIMARWSKVKVLLVLSFAIGGGIFPIVELLSVL